MNSAGFDSGRPSRRLRQLRTALRSEKGQIVLMSALTLPILLGIAALTIDASFMYEKRNRLHAAADGAAKSAAMEVRRGNVAAENLLAFARREVTAMGFNNSVVQAVNCPPASGSYTGGVCGTSSTYVEVILQEPTSTFFARVLGFPTMTPTARAVAGASRSKNCIISLAGTGTGISIVGGSSISAANCNIAANSTSSTALSVSGGSTVTARSVGVTGSYSVVGGSSVNPTPQTGVPASSDPLAGLPTPTINSPCMQNGVDSNGLPTYIVGYAGATLNPGTYCGFLFNGGGAVTLNPGTYVLQGNIQIGNGASVNATGGVTIYNMGGLLQVNGGSPVNLTAPTSGVYYGIAYWQPASSNRTINITNGAQLNVNGIWYGPTAPFRLNGGTAFSSTCSIVVTYSFDISNGAAFGNNCAVFGGNPLRTVTVAE